MRKAYGYTRVSTEEQVDGESLKTQKEKITEYAKNNDFEIDPAFKNCLVPYGPKRKLMP